MARSGIHKSEVQRARERLVSQGRNPSIDAVRAELGNTGSRTTIQRYLRELEEEDGGGTGKSVAVSEAIQELASRLGARLHEEAEARWVEQRQQLEAKLHEKEGAITQLRQENTGLSDQLQRTELALREETARRAAVEQELAGTHVEKQRLSQEVSNLTSHLEDSRTHQRSLDEKHQHAREALEHYRQSNKEQREQELRRHEHQIQQLQVEIRTLNQSLVIKQDELTRSLQELARTTTELPAARKAARQAEEALGKLEKAYATSTQRISSLETANENLVAHLEQQRLATEAVEQRLVESADLLRVRDAEGIRLQATVDIQAKLLASLAAVGPQG
ncbi:DNA-binding protein [Chitinolyticbacter meiyuanensis]|uniref:DNA-binding protein n=1 Tax=Chitinolyticbacter meiyuanensis TaxID=682798 RepID=UPI0011E5B10B|nr:DNA-binding protein [Chitinolyticbacter meiyuanensis]